MAGSSVPPMLSMLVIMITLPPRCTKRFEQPAFAQRVRKVAVARCVLARLPILVEKNLAFRRDAQGQMLVEGGDALPVQVVPERVADAGVGGMTGHQPEWRGSAVAALDRTHLGAPQIEEAFARNGVDQGLDHAAHARGHAAREHQQRNLSSSQRLGAELAQASVLGTVRRGQPLQILRVRGADRAFDEVVLRALRAEPSGQALEALGIEAMVREARLNVGGSSASCRSSESAIAGEASTGRFRRSALIRARRANRAEPPSLPLAASARRRRPGFRVATCVCYARVTKSRARAKVAWQGAGYRS